MSWKEKVFANFKLYAVTDLRENSPVALEKIETVYRGGADIVQLRSKHLADRELLEIGRKIRILADRYQKLFFINDRPDLAMILQADGVHLGQDDLPAAEVRQLFARSNFKAWIGKSTHNLEQGLKAIEEKPDYVAVGPVFETPTKPGYPPAGLEYVKQASEKFHLPFVAIGGIDLMNLHEVLAAGARRIAVVRAIFDAPDPYKAATEFRKTIVGADPRVRPAGQAQGPAPAIADGII